MSRINKAVLDVDPTIMENNLLIADPNSGLDTLFPRDAGPASKVVLPIPGLCVKLRRASGEGEGSPGKVFVNLCHTKEIPAPEDINEERLLQLWNADNESCEYRVPLSIGERREEPDKSGKPAEVFDVAVNTTFFGKVESSNLFRMFVLEVVMQGIEEKFNIELDKEDYVILKNRRSMGSIPGHRVRVSDRPGEAKPAAPLIQELGTSYSPAPPPAASQGASLSERPEFRLLQQPGSGSPRQLLAQVHLPDVVSLKGVSLDVGEDRMVLTSDRRSLDLFLPHNVSQDSTTARFDSSSKILTVTMPVEVHAT